MAIKLIAIGNRIMGDDAIGIRVAEELLQKLEKHNMEVIFGETDTHYSLSKIGEGDFLFILDSAYYDKKPGTVTLTPLGEDTLKHKCYSQHEPSLIDLIGIYKKEVRGYILGIEVEEIKFGFELSDALEQRISQVCEEVYENIKNILRGIDYA